RANDRAFAVSPEISIEPMSVRNATLSQSFQSPSQVALSSSLPVQSNKWLVQRPSSVKQDSHSSRSPRQLASVYRPYSCRTRSCSSVDPVKGMRAPLPVTWFALFPLPPATVQRNRLPARPNHSYAEWQKGELPWTR